VGQACRLGQAVSGRAGKGDFYCIVQGAHISDGDKDGFDICACSKDGADGIGLVFQKAVFAFLGWGLFEGADESAFCTADGGFLEEKTKMGRQTQSSRVGYSLTIDNEDIRRGIEFFGRCDTGWRFSEGKQARDIGENKLSDGIFCFDDFKIVQFQDDDGGDYFSSGFAEGTIQACNKFGLFFDRCRFCSGGEFFLQLDCLFRGQFPVVQVVYSHL